MMGTPTLSSFCSFGGARSIDASLLVHRFQCFCKLCCCACACACHEAVNSISRFGAVSCVCATAQSSLLRAVGIRK